MRARASAIMTPHDGAGGGTGAQEGQGRLGDDDEAGLGIDLDEAALARHPYREATLRPLRRPEDE